MSRGIDVQTATTSAGTKPTEIELWSNRRLIHPLSRRLAIAFSRTPITPNVVSALGVVASIGAAIMYSLPVWPASVAGGFVCQFAWHVLDGADGELARRTGRSSPSGEVVDGVCDYLSQAAVYSALALMLSHTIGGWAWALALASGVARAVQANSYESRRRIYQYWGYGGRWIRQTVSSGESAPKGWLGLFARAYLSISDRVARSSPELEAALLARFEQGVDGEKRARLMYRTAQIKVLRIASPLSANARTIAIALSMLADSPLYFFVYEIVGLTALMLWSLHIQARTDAALTRELASET
ncbi:MAG: CDP-alcohol phosphatidyltransferase family protein [Caulobacteraceae bacterium]